MDRRVYPPKSLGFPPPREHSLNVTIPATFMNPEKCPLMGSYVWLYTVQFAPKSSSEYSFSHKLYEKNEEPLDTYSYQTVAKA